MSIAIVNGRVLDPGSELDGQHDVLLDNGLVRVKTHVCRKEICSKHLTV